MAGKKEKEIRKRGIAACTRCGSTDVTGTPGNEFAIVDRLGLGSVAGLSTCRKCGHVGIAIVLNDEKSYRRFCEELKKKRKKRA